MTNKLENLGESVFPAKKNNSAPMRWYLSLECTKGGGGEKFNQ